MQYLVDLDMLKGEEGKEGEVLLDLPQKCEYFCVSGASKRLRVEKKL